MAGFQFPFDLDRDTGEIKMTSELRDIQEAVQIILTTEKGERLMHPDFGVRLNRFAFEPIDSTLKSLIRQEVISALLQWEDRIENITVEFEEQQEEGKLIVLVGYCVKKGGMSDSVKIPLRRNELVRISGSESGVTSAELKGRRGGGG